MTKYYHFSMYQKLFESLIKDIIKPHLGQRISVIPYLSKRKYYIIFIHTDTCELVFSFLVFRLILNNVTMGCESYPLE